MENKSASNKDGWIRVRDSMPGIGKIVEALFSYQIEASSLLFDFCVSHEKLCFIANQFNSLRSDCYDEKKVTHWRYPKERKPDFSKLKDRDFIVIKDIDGNSKKIFGYIESIKHKVIMLNSSSCIDE